MHLLLLLAGSAADCVGWSAIQERLAVEVQGHAAVEAQRVLAAVEVARPDTECAVGARALSLVEALAGGDVKDTLEELQAMGWLALLRSEWPIFQLIYLLHRHFPKGQPCVGSEAKSYSKKLQRALQNKLQPGEMSLTAASMAFFATADAAACPSLASAAALAIAWARLPVYDAESEGLLRFAEQQTSLRDLAFSHRGHPLPLVAARLAAARQLAGRLQTEAQEPKASACVVPFAHTQSGRCNVFAPIWQALVTTSDRFAHRAWSRGALAGSTWRTMAMACHGFL